MSSAKASAVPASSPAPSTEPKSTLRPAIASTAADFETCLVMMFSPSLFVGRRRFVKSDVQPVACQVDAPMGQRGDSGTTREVDGRRRQRLGRTGGERRR